VQSTAHSHPDRSWFPRPADRAIRQSATKVAAGLGCAQAPAELLSEFVLSPVHRVDVADQRLASDRLDASVSTDLAAPTV
jgi:hypothetical protein